MIESKEDNSKEKEVPLEDWMVEMEKRRQNEEKVLHLGKISEKELVVNFSNDKIDPITGEIKRVEHCDSCEA